MDALILGATIGLAAGISPGPLLFLTITLLVLGQMTDQVLSAIGVVGGFFVGLLGMRTWLEARTASLRQARDQPHSPTLVALREGVVVNLLSPHPWIAWGTALGPMTLAAWREQPVSGIAFVAGFYALLVGAKVVLALLAGQGRQRLTDPGYRTALRVAGGLLVVTGVVLVVEFGLSLV